MKARVLEAARGLRERMLTNPKQNIASSMLLAQHGISRRTALLLLRLLTYAGLLEEKREGNFLVFAPTGNKLPPIADVIAVIRTKGDDAHRALTPEALAALFGYSEEAAREALTAAGVDLTRNRKTHKPPAKPDAPAIEPPPLKLHGLRRHSLGWLHVHASSNRRPIVISQDRLGPFAFPGAPIDASRAWRLGDPIGDVSDWSWEQLRGLVKTAREQELKDRALGARVKLPPRRTATSMVNVWVTGRRPPDPSNKHRPTAVTWEILWSGTPDSALHGRQGGRLLLSVDPEADIKVVIAMLDVDGERARVIKVDELLPRGACPSAAAAAHRGTLAMVVKIVELAYKAGGWTATHRVVH